MPDKPSGKQIGELNKATVQPLNPQPEKPKGPGLELFPTQNGNELFVISKMLEALNKNVAFLSVTIDKHLNPDKYKGKEEPKKDG